jgi:hypothetical protein
LARDANGLLDEIFWSRVYIWSKITRTRLLDEKIINHIILCDNSESLFFSFDETIETHCMLRCFVVMIELENLSLRIKIAFGSARMKTEINPVKLERFCLCKCQC